MYGSLARCNNSGWVLQGIAHSPIPQQPLRRVPVLTADAAYNLAMALEPFVRAA